MGDNAPCSSRERGADSQSAAGSVCRDFGRSGDHGVPVFWGQTETGVI